MQKLVDVARRHQIVAFFVLTYAITWGLGFSYGAVMKRGQFLLAPLVFLATCGPALAGIILTAVTNTEPKKGARKGFWIAFLVAWAVSAVVFSAHNTFFNGTPFSPAMAGFALVAVLPVAFILGMTYSRIPSVRNYLSTLIRLRGRWGWALLALVLIPGLIALSIAASRLLGRQPIGELHLPESALVLTGLIAIKFVYQLFFFNATGEEVGWRGFALPRLQACASPLVAALVIALFWAPWHFFLWRAEGAPVFALPYWMSQGGLHILASLFIVWIYNRARGSILVAGITHAAANTVMSIISLQDTRTLFLTWTAAALVMVLADRMWKRLPPDHPARTRPEPDPILSNGTP